jgi:hypothetical protein
VEVEAKVEAKSLTSPTKPSWLQNAVGEANAIEEKRKRVKVEAKVEAKAEAKRAKTRRRGRRMRRRQ